MELKPGYKQTEVGVIPEDWECVKIGSVAKLESGHTPSKRQPSYWGGAIPWVSLHDTDGLGGREILETEKMITEEGLKNSSARLLPAGTVVFSRTATVGKTTVLGRSMSTSQDFANYICGPLLDPFFLMYLFRSMGRTWKSLMAGSIHNTIYMPVFRALQIALPPISEQHTIVSALSDVDSLIDSLEQLIAKKRLLKQAAMQDLLTGKRRLPGFEGESGWQQTDVGEIPRDWKVHRLDDIGETLIGLTYTPGDVSDSGILVLRSSNIQEGRLSFEDNVFVNEPVPDRVVTREGDILICVRNGSRQLIGKCALVDQRTAGSAFGAFMSIFRSKYNQFVFLQFRSEIIKRQIGESLGATINQITNADMKRFQIPLPPAESEQTAIAAILSDMEAEIAALEAKLAKARQIKRGMMQELLTGKTRLL